MKWSATYDTFGNCSIDVEDIENNLRFAGQYFDVETGLHYNWNRYYDPETGRYMRVDPVGEGLNLYLYVQNNPLKYIDPRGLTATRSQDNYWTQNNTSNQQTSVQSNQGEDYAESLNLNPTKSIVARVVDKAIVKATSFHFEGRDAINDPYKNYNYNDVESNREWTKLDNWQVGTHNNKVGKIELKYVHNKTGAELVFDGDSPDKQLTQIGIKGTPNYVNPMPSSQVNGIGSALKFVGKSAGHFFADVVPFWIGGDVRGPDPD